MNGPDLGLLAAPDSFKGTLGAVEAARAIAVAARRTGWVPDVCPMSDGGEGFGAVLAASAGTGSVRWETAAVSGPLGSRVPARWWRSSSEAVVESASASGLVLAGGATGNDPMRADTRGTGELIAAALRTGLGRVLLGVGGSASTDGGRGALEALVDAGGLGGAELVVACDVNIAFLDAAKRFGPQKGASKIQVVELSRRLESLAAEYESRFGVDVTKIARAGAAGGLAGGLAALGARLVDGFELVAERAGLARRISSSRLVVTGEGRFDATSWSGKVVGGVVRLAHRVGRPVVVVAGEVAPDGVAELDQNAEVELVSLSELFGAQRAFAEPEAAISEALEGELRRRHDQS